MMRARRTSHRPLIVLGALTLACSGDPYGAAAPGADPKGASAEAKTAAAKTAETKTPAKDTKAPGGDSSAQGKKIPAVPTRYDDGKPLARVLEGKALPLVELLGQPPAKVESLLGPPLPDQKGGMRKSCVRFLPERTWFRCQHAWQRYSDKTETFGVVQVTYEDGKSTAVAFENIPGAGTFAPKQALTKVGLALPGVAKLENPQEGVTVWSWFNSEARLMIHGRQYRVRVSTVDGKWETAKVEVILNDELDQSERARVFTPRGEGDTPGDTPAG